MQINEVVDGFRFQSVTPKDKERFMSVGQDMEDITEYYRKYPAFEDYSWNLILKDEDNVNMVVFHMPEGKFIATCSFLKVRSRAIELAYGVVNELRGKGLGTQMISALAKLAHKLFPEQEILIKVRKENNISKHVAEKCGGIFIRTEDPPEVVTIHKLLKKDGMLPSSTAVLETLKHGHNSVLVYRM